VWYVDGDLWSGGVENQRPNQTSEHPAPKLLQTPVTLDFRSLGKGTYPVWYDPSFWYARSTVRLDPARQIRELRENLGLYRDIALDTVAFIVGGLVLCALLLRERRHLTVHRNTWWQVAWPLAAFSMYAFVHVERRFLGAFFVLLWLAIYSALTSKLSRSTATIVCWAVIVTVMLPFTARTVRTMVHIPTDFAHPKTLNYEAIGRSLGDLGLQSGDRLAIVGYAYDCYYARYDRLRIVAQIPDARGFWQLSAAESEAMEKRLASVGVKAIVARNRPETSRSSSWKDVWGSGSSRLSVLLLPSRS
jgi:hypothetical protein